MKPVSYIVKEKVWLIPAVYSVAAVLLSLAAFFFDLYLVERISRFIPSIFLTSVEVGQTILGILTAAMLTMTTFTFSTVLVVLTTYTSQFSPRAPENFIRSRSTKHVLGIFVAGFTFNLLSLLYIREDVFKHEILTTSIGIFLVFFCIATFAYYIHFVATNVQVSTLINKLTADAEEVIGHYTAFQKEEFVSMEEWNVSGEHKTLISKSAGYLQFLDFEGLVKLAEKREIQIEILVHIGEYVYEGKPLMQIYKTKEQKFSIDEFFTVGDERTADQDLDYAVQKIVEVAIRAISPGRQDPNTANDILIRLGHILGKMGHLKTDDLILTDSTGNKRVLYRFLPYREILYKAFYQMSYQGRNDISVISSMTESLLIAAAIAPDWRHKTVWLTQLYILEGINHEALKEADWAYLQKKVDDLALMTRQSSIDLSSLSSK